MSPASWTVTVSDANQRSAAYGANAWVNVNSALSISVPIGLWSLAGTAVSCQVAPTTPSTILRLDVALSQSNNSLSNATPVVIAQYFYLTAATISGMAGLYQPNTLISVAAKTTYYLVMREGSGTTGTFYARGDNTPSVLDLVCVYL